MHSFGAAAQTSGPAQAVPATTTTSNGALRPFLAARSQRYASRCICFKKCDAVYSLYLTPSSCWCCISRVFGIAARSHHYEKPLSNLPADPAFIRRSVAGPSGHVSATTTRDEDMDPEDANCVPSSVLVDGQYLTRAAAGRRLLCVHSRFGVLAQVLLLRQIPFVRTMIMTGLTRPHSSRRTARPMLKRLKLLCTCTWRSRAPISMVIIATMSSRSLLRR